MGIASADRMALKLHELYDNQFSRAVNDVVTPSSPIRSSTHLKGRKKQYEDVKQAIYAVGRHVIIYGERGVGKTSLARTCGAETSTNATCFRQIGCSSATTLGEIAKQIVSAFAPDKLNAEVQRRGWSVSNLLGYASETSTSVGPAQVTSVGEVADLLCSLDAAAPDELRVVVIDEVDRLKDIDVKSQLAELIKLLGDRSCRLTIIMTGVGEDVRDLLGAHPSAHRQIAQIKLERLQFGDSVEIVTDAFERFSLNAQSEPCRTIMFRIASIANGFPYYAHLLIEEFLYSLYRDKSANEVTLTHLRNAVEEAVTKAIEEVRKPYDMATRGRHVRYKWLAWAVADSWDLERSTSDVYRSYKNIVDFFGEPADSERKIGPALAAMKRPSFGQLLKTGYRNRLHEYSENLVRGYARLCAASEDLELNDLRNDSPKIITAHGRPRRFFDPSRLGGPPAGFRR